MIKLWIYGPTLPPDRFIKKAQDEYIKRLSRIAAVRFRPLDRVPADALWFCPQGDEIDSPGLAALFSERLLGGNELHLALWEVPPEAARFKFQLTCLALSPGTESVLLLEQIYRAFKILSGEPYHK